MSYFNMSSIIITGVCNRKECVSVYMCGVEVRGVRGGGEERGREGREEGKEEKEICMTRHAWSQ